MMSVLNQSLTKSVEEPCIEPMTQVDMSIAVAVFMPFVRRRSSPNPFFG